MPQVQHGKPDDAGPDDDVVHLTLSKDEAAAVVEKLAEDGDGSGTPAALAAVIDTLRDALVPPPPPAPLSPRDLFRVRVRAQMPRTARLSDADLDQVYYLAHFDDVEAAS